MQIGERLGVVTALTTKTFGKVVANLGWKDVRFPRPVRPGDTVYVESEILGTRESKSRVSGRSGAHSPRRIMNIAPEKVGWSPVIAR